MSWYDSSPPRHLSDHVSAEHHLDMLLAPSLLLGLNRHVNADPRLGLLLDLNRLVDRHLMYLPDRHVNADLRLGLLLNLNRPVNGHVSAGHPLGKLLNLNHHANAETPMGRLKHHDPVSPVSPNPEQHHMDGSLGEHHHMVGIMGVSMGGNIGGRRRGMLPGRQYQSPDGLLVQLRHQILHGVRQSLDVKNLRGQPEPRSVPRLPSP
ncbi:hypothetical protein V8F06_014050 [Rhypophila decipiens]